MYEYKPPHKNSKAQAVCICLLGASAVCFVTAGIVKQFPVIFQSIGLFLLVPFIQIVGKYLVLRYLYRIHDRADGSCDFEVFTYRGGTRMQLVCRVGLNEITAVEELNEQNKQPPRGVRRYYYLPDLSPKNALLLSVTNGDGDCQILLAPDERLTAVFENAVAENKKDFSAGKDTL